MVYVCDMYIFQPNLTSVLLHYVKKQNVPANIIIDT